ncbi:MAG: FAD:protein FMN transferase [Deltaproteobacteria bacterium]|nr:FAD:protein FMN transferase [Deltaproteobacteria bacterium]
MKRILFAAVLFARTQVLMGDVPVSLTIKAPESKKIAAFTAMEEAFDRAREIEGEVSEFRPNSQTSRLNRNAGGEWMPIGEHLTRILELSFRISDLTNGAFDVTFASPDKAVTFRDIELRGDKSPHPPFFKGGNKSVTPLSQRGGGGDFYARLSKRGTNISVSGIAKGYIVDQMADSLKKAGFKKFLINAGGEILARGRWKVSIRDPENPDGEPVLNLKIKNRAVSTSGLYERGHHIFDANTKKPVERSGSVTVIAKNSSLADAWDTAAFIMGKEKIEAIRNKIPDIEFIFIENGQIN